MPAHDIAPTRIALVGAAIGATVLAVVAAVLIWLHFAHLNPGGDRLTRPYHVGVPGAALESAPQPDLRRDRAEKRRRLESAGWVDRRAGIAHIPIETAIALRAAGAASAAPPASAPDAARMAAAAAMRAAASAPRSNAAGPTKAGTTATPTTAPATTTPPTAPAATASPIPASAATRAPTAASHPGARR